MKQNLQIRKICCRETAGRLLFVFAAVMLVNSVRLCFCGDIWYDELFTVGMAEHSYGELISFTAKDVHPPLYYCIVKAILDFCKRINPSVNSVIVIKCVSVLPYLLLTMYGLLFLRKKFGMFVTGLFLFCVLSMPQMSAYTVEMRMYGWALFFVTAAFFHAYEIVEGKGHFMPFMLYGLAAAYTQYFACVAVIMVYVYLLLWFFCRYRHSHGKDKDASGTLGRLSICVGLSIFAYLPWLFILIAQITAVRDNYWILPLTWRSLGGCVKFLMKPAFSEEWLNVLLAVLLSGIYIGLFVWYGFRGWKADGDGFFKIRFFYALAGCMVLCGLTGFGFIASILVRPVFVYRYMLPAMGCFWFCPVLCLDGLFTAYPPEEEAAEGTPGRKKRRFFRGALCFSTILIAVIGLRNYRAFLGEEEYKAVLMQETEPAISDIALDDIILYNFDQLQAVMGYYLEQENYLWGGEPEPLVQEIFGIRGSVSETGQIQNWLEEGRTVWFFGSFNSREAVRAEWEKDGILTEEKGSYMLERYWFNLYSVFTE